MTDSFEHGSETYGPTERGEFIDKLSDYCLFERDSTPWSHSFSDFLLNDTSHVIPGPGGILYICYRFLGSDAI
jgi:hypothetical protein